MANIRSGCLIFFFLSIWWNVSLAKECVNEFFTYPKMSLLNGDYVLAKKNFINFGLYDETGESDFYLSVTNVRLKEFVAAKRNMKKAFDNGYYLAHAFYAFSHKYGVLGYEKNEAISQKYKDAYIEAAKKCEEAQQTESGYTHFFKVLLDVEIDQ